MTGIGKSQNKTELHHLLQLPGAVPGTNNLLSAGTGRCQVKLYWYTVGPDLFVSIYNDCPHIGAVALADFEPASGRAWASVLSAVGHREDALAHTQARRISARLHCRVCLVAGIHLDEITAEEICLIEQSAQEAVGQLLDLCRNPGSV